MSAPLPKHYDPTAVERQRYEQWEASGVFHNDPDAARPPFIIAMPPPNITGRAHLGHASTYTAMDVLTRYHRMLGENADWLPGQDHAAIATEAVIVRDLAAGGQSRESLGRDRFLEHAWEWRRTYGGIINDQFRILGFGADWERERFTMDAGLSAAVNRAFVQLHREGYLYRGRRLVNWDPKAQSTLSDAEVEYEERDGKLWNIRYTVADGDDALIVATTRPETMLGDMAVAVHPEDPRYWHLHGKQLRLPLTGRLIPVVADEAVEREFGTGAVKVTPAHDPVDYEIGLRHGLAMPSILDLEGRIATDDPALTGDLAPFAGMDRFEAREAVVDALRQSGELVSEEAYRHNVAVSSRSHAVIEPLLSLQWFCKMQDLAKPALEALHQGKLRFFADRNARTYEQWLTNIRDWNVSRQIWWGHRLPVWYTPDDQIIVAETEEAAHAQARERFGDVQIRRDEDTLDTWFSSALWPFSILGWPDQTEEFRHWYPTQVLVTAREIIFLWVARMVMLGLKLAGDVPFYDVLITPLVFDEHGRKMSKSLGNAIDPLDLIARYGADATRFGILRQMHLESQELRFNENRCAEAALFNNKIWNALMYLRSLPEGVPQPAPLPVELSAADHWILGELERTIKAATGALDRYEFSTYIETCLDFIWYRVCDWYIEATKVEEAKPTRAAVLSYVLNTAMRLIHPISPFISEEVWQALPHDGQTIVTASWPDTDEFSFDHVAHTDFEEAIAFITADRIERAELQIKPGKREPAQALDVLADSIWHDLEDRGVPRANAELFAARFAALLPYLRHIGKLETATGVRFEELNDPASEALVSNHLKNSGELNGQLLRAVLKVRHAAEGLEGRYEREVAKLQSEVERCRKKLANEAFRQKAAPHVVAEEEAKLEKYQSDLADAERKLAASRG